eukprot:1147316-Pelagomonas_calceolata.AAC.5
MCPAPATASHAPLTLQGCLELLFGGVAKFQGGGCPGRARAAKCGLCQKLATLGAHAPQMGLCQQSKLQQSDGAKLSSGHLCIPVLPGTHNWLAQ